MRTLDDDVERAYEPPPPDAVRAWRTGNASLDAPTGPVSWTRSPQALPTTRRVGAAGGSRVDDDEEAEGGGRSGDADAGGGASSGSSGRGADAAAARPPPGGSWRPRRTGKRWYMYWSERAAAGGCVA